MSCALVAFVDLLRVCKVQSGYRWEFFRGGGGAGEDGGAGADSDIEHLDLNFSILYLLHAVLKEVGISAPGGVRIDVEAGLLERRMENYPLQKCQISNISFNGTLNSWREVHGPFENDLLS